MICLLTGCPESFLAQESGAKTQRFLNILYGTELISQGHQVGHQSVQQPIDLEEGTNITGSVESTYTRKHPPCYIGGHLCTRKTAEEGVKPKW